MRILTNFIIDKYIVEPMRCPALIMGVPGLASHPRQTPKRGAGLMQLQLHYTQ